MGHPIAEELRRNLTMLRPRIIPCLLVKNGGLVKTVKFGDSKYVGDPINAVRIFNEKEVDEIIVLDIDAARERREPNYTLIQSLAAECRMPLCYGGGVRTAEQFQRLVSLGVEKVAISSAAVETPDLVTEAAEKVGSQSVAVVMDIKKAGLVGSYQMFTYNGTKNTGMDPVEFAKRMDALGAGEIIINSIDRDGTMKGYDLELIKRVRAATSRPMTVLGGAGSLQDMTTVLKALGQIGVAAGSLFVFKGVYRAVLINYPTRGEKDALIRQVMPGAA
jgi:cyclase